MRWVSKCRTCGWKAKPPRRQQLFISQALGHEWIACEEITIGAWSAYFYDSLPARLDELDFRLRA